jgi:phenylalanine-4-hydroxylase
MTGQDKTMESKLPADNSKCLRDKLNIQEFYTVYFTHKDLSQIFDCFCSFYAKLHGVN